MSNFAKLQELLKNKKASLKTAGRTIKPKPGKNLYVLLPPWRGGDDMQFWHDFGQHYIKDEAGVMQAVYVCANDTFGKPCSICDGLAEANRTVGIANPDVAKIIKEARSGLSFLVGVLALDSDTPDTPQVLALGKKAFGQLVTNVEDWAEQLFDSTSPQIIQIERTGTTQNDTVYTVTMTPKKHTYKRKVEPINLDEFVAQESEEQERKALLAIRSVSGMGGVGRNPALDRPQTKAIGTSPKKVVDEFEDVPDFPTQPAATKVAAPEITDDIDAMLSDLDV